MQGAGIGPVLERIGVAVITGQQTEDVAADCKHRGDDAELSTEQNCNMIDGVPNNTPIPPTPPELDAKPLDKVKEPKERRKGRELER